MIYSTDRITIRYIDIPDEYKITQLRPRVENTLLTENWNYLVYGFEQHYNYKQIGQETPLAFNDALRDTFRSIEDTMEKYLEVYYDDIAKPILGRTEKRTYDIVDEGESENDSSNEALQRFVDVPNDNPALDTDSTRTKDNGSATASSKSKGTRKGTETVELSDLGVRPNYETLNGFLDENRTLIQEFNRHFKPCFMLVYSRMGISVDDNDIRRL